MCLYPIEKYQTGTFPGVHFSLSRRNHQIMYLLETIKTLYRIMYLCVRTLQSLLYKILNYFIH